MPQIIIHYTAQLDRETDMTALCRTLADTMLTVRDDEGQQVFPTGGVRVMAYPAPHYAVADGGTAGRAAARFGERSDDYAFVYLNVRMGRGRSTSAQQRAGEVLTQATHAHFAKVFGERHIGITLQIDVGQEVFDNKHSNIHPLFQKG
jgi:5-carboxymethyl-2-hydroxymuconate isomerase